MPQIPKNRPPTEELMLVDLTQRLERMRVGRSAVHIHLSGLSQAYNSNDYIRIATKSFSNNVSGLEGHLFVLEDEDLIFIVKDAAPTILEQAVKKIESLFLQDPITAPTNQAGDSAFCNRYDLEKNYDDFLILAQDKLRKAQQRREKKGENKPIAYKKRSEGLGPATLGAIEKSLQNIDVSNLIRRQTVCTVIDKHPPQTLFEEVFISLNELETLISPGTDIDSDLWLFRYLTKILDIRMLRMLTRDGVTTTRPFSINLNISSVLTTEFTRFQNTIAPQLKDRLVIELNKLDVFANMGEFLFARDFLHDAGFRICLDGLTHHTMPYYDREKLGFDLVKLFWAPNAVDTMPSNNINAMRNVIIDTGQAHTILCRCDNERAIETGQELGIVMFQGRHIDKLIANAAAPPPPPQKYIRV